MAKITPEHKVDRGSGNFFGEGVYKVNIMFVKNDKTPDGKEFVEFTLVNDEEKEAKVRLWLHTDGAIGYTFGTLRNIFVHNAPEGQKDKMRAQIDAIDETEKLVEACNLLIGKECWLKVTKSDRTYTAADGTQKQSYNRDMFGYEPQNVPKTPDSVSLNDLPAGSQIIDKNDANLPSGF